MLNHRLFVNPHAKIKLFTEYQSRISDANVNNGTNSQKKIERKKNIRTSMNLYVLDNSRTRNLFGKKKLIKVKPKSTAFHQGNNFIKMRSILYTSVLL